VVFAFGLTHDVNALLPVMLGSAIAYGFTVIVLRRSILTEKIARRGRHVFREYGVDPLEQQFVDEVMTREVVSIAGEESVAEVLERFFGPGQKHRAYPVLDSQRLLGMLDRDLLREVPEAQRDTPVSRLPFPSEAFLLPGDTCRAAALRLAADSLQRLPVIGDPESRRVVGIVSCLDLLKPVRHVHAEEAHRERTFSLAGVTWLRRSSSSTPGPL
jgi:CBS domain-containing protein